MKHTDHSSISLHLDAERDRVEVGDHQHSISYIKSG